LAGNTTIKGLVINRFQGDGIHLQTNGINSIVGNFIGTDVTGSQPLGNGNGLSIGGGSGNNTIGGTSAAARNLISGNTAFGVLITDVATTDNKVLGNYIGMDTTGTNLVGNGEEGLFIVDSPANRIGDSAAGAGNLISGNRVGGIRIDNATANVVLGNLIGTDAAGMLARPNGNGVMLNNSWQNTIGDTGFSAPNVISGNFTFGIFIGGTSANNQIQGALIGVAKNGIAPLGNGTYGVFIYGTATNNTVGGTAPGAGNVLSANFVGIEIAGLGATGNQIQGNFIGTDLTGTVAVGNIQEGVLINAPANTVGGTVAGTRNVISGNRVDGIGIIGDLGTQNLIQGNFIGTDVNGTASLGNFHSGIYFDSATANTIGGTIPEARNIISGNGSGIFIFNADHMLIQGNYVGTDVTGTLALGNSNAGILASGPSNTIGGTLAGAGNVISGNGWQGIAIVSQYDTGNLVQGNWIGTAADGVSPLGNVGPGIDFTYDASFNTIGGVGSGEGNIIAFNGTYGVYVFTGTSNSIRGNSMFSNTQLGIRLESSNPVFPELTRAFAGQGSTTILGTYSGAPNTVYLVDFYANTVAHSSGFGEGESYLGTLTITTDDSGIAAFTAVFNAEVPQGQFIAATATDPNNTTSEFSRDVVVESPPGAPSGSRQPHGADAALASLPPALSNPHEINPAIVLTVPDGNQLMGGDAVAAHSSGVPMHPDLFFENIGRNSDGSGHGWLMPLHRLHDSPAEGSWAGVLETGI
jgi:titin